MSTAKSILSPVQEKEHQTAVYAGAVKGFFGALAIALPTSFILQRRSHFYRSLTPALKTFGVILVTIPSFVICAERAGLAYERSQFAEWYVPAIGSHKLPVDILYFTGTKSALPKLEVRGSVRRLLVRP